MVQAYGIVSECGDFVNELIGFSFGQETGVSDHIDPGETDAFMRSLCKRKVTVRTYRHRSVFSCRSIQTAGKVQRGTFYDFVVKFKRQPFFSGRNDDTARRGYFFYFFNFFFIRNGKFQFKLPGIHLPGNSHRRQTDRQTFSPAVLDKQVAGTVDPVHISAVDDDQIFYRAVKNYRSSRSSGQSERLAVDKQHIFFSKLCQQDLKRTAEGEDLFC